MKKLMMSLLFLITQTVFAQKEEKVDIKESKNTSEIDHKHHVSLFTGATTNYTSQSSDFTIGLDYEYRISKLLGVGLLGEYIAFETGELIYGIFIMVHPTNGLKLGIEPLLNRVENHGLKEDFFLFRINATYDFHIENYTIGPSISYDIGDSQALVYGVAFGMEF